MTFKRWVNTYIVTKDFHHPNRYWLKSRLFVFRYSLAEMPVIRLKYFPKTDWEGKFKLSLICWIDMLVESNNALLSVMTYSSIIFNAVLPVTSLTTWDRCFAVMHNLSA